MYRVLSDNGIFKLQKRFLFWWRTVEENSVGAGDWLEKYNCEYVITLALEE